MKRLVFYAALASCFALRMDTAAATEKPFKILRVPIRAATPDSLDPVQGFTPYHNQVVSPVYETLLQYKYLTRPPQLEPLLLAKTPKVSDDGRTYQCELKKGVRFHDDPCFPCGKGRELVASDVFYSWKRMADARNEPKNWWLFEGLIAGFDEYRDEQNSAQKFDYDAPVEGFRQFDDYRFDVVLKQPSARFFWLLAMFQSAIVPHEAVAYYGKQFVRHPVGTGPFVTVADDRFPEAMIYERNKNYRLSRYPKDHMPEDERSGFDSAAGTRLPICDRVEVHFCQDDEQMWADFRSGKLDYVQLPSNRFGDVFHDNKLKPALPRDGMVVRAVELLDFIYHGFNMADPVVGGYSRERKFLRQAISLAIDLQAFNEAFYNNSARIYDGPIPPGLPGFPKNGVAPKNYRGPDLDRARDLLKRAGFPHGDGLPAIRYVTAAGETSRAQADMLQQQLNRIGVRLDVVLVDFATLMQVLYNGKAPFFGLGWGSDYPDPENNLSIFYGPNVSAGSNSFNYKNRAYDKLYEQIHAMQPSAERTRICEKMRDMLIEDAPFVGSMARRRYYIVNSRLKNFKPTEMFFNWYKYLDVDDARQ